MIVTQVLDAPDNATSNPQLKRTLSRVFGSPSDSIEEVERRARMLLDENRVIVWEGDAATFQFHYVGGAAEGLLGHPRDKWIELPTFWADVVVHPEDRDEAIAFCAVATGKCEDHDFVYRATTASGEVVWLHDVVTVIRGPKGVADRLRGIMMEVPASE